MAALCVVGSLRVGLFAAAFPLGNNIDEPQHLDVVFRYSRADWPRGERERFDPHVMLVLAGLASFEYLHPPTRRGEDAMPPPYWAQPPESRSRVVERRRAHWLQYANHELLSPPAYYALAALWLRAEEAVGVEPLRASYGVRFLNVPLFALLLWCTWRFCRDAYPSPRSSQSP